MKDLLVLAALLLACILVGFVTCGISRETDRGER